MNKQELQVWSAFDLLKPKLGEGERDDAAAVIRDYAAYDRNLAWDVFSILWYAACQGEGKTGRALVILKNYYEGHLHCHHSLNLQAVQKALFCVFRDALELWPESA